jgi:hypothetical protein
MVGALWILRQRRIFRRWAVVRGDIRGLCPEAAFYFFDDVAAYPLAAYLVWVCTFTQTMFPDARPCESIDISLRRYIMPAIFREL